ncbi:MAG TPA: hypothetical protein ENI99_03120 [Sedimenticola sp.]|nr:hypothetical protein [Sedimenticola sp.]
MACRQALWITFFLIALSAGAGAATVSEGVFDGYDPKAQRVWINDFAYLLDPGLKVVGSPTKAGAISAIKEGEIVQFMTRPNPARPAMPFVTEIRRR